MTLKELKFICRNFCNAVKKIQVISLVLFLTPQISFSNNRTKVAKNKITLCSQNLENLSLTSDLVETKKTNEVLFRTDLFVTRFLKQNCDLIAVQELVDKNDGDAKKTIRLLTQKLSNKSKAKRKRYKFLSIVTRQTNLEQKIGVIVNRNIFRVEKADLQKYKVLPKHTTSQRPRVNLRTPLLVRLSLRKNKNIKLSVFIIHFKSKHGAKDDPQKLMWETYRMEMAQELNERINKEIKKGQIVIVMGDRNSEINSASNLILTGKLKLSDFKNQLDESTKSRGCKILKDLSIYCDDFTENRTKNFELSSLVYKDYDSKIGSYNYKGKLNKIDDIITNNERVGIKLKKIKGGVLLISEKIEPSDHKMVWAKVFLKQ